MIARSLPFFLLLIVLPDVYLWWRFLRTRRRWVQLLWYVPGVLLVAATILLARQPDFVPDDMTLTNLYLFCMALLPLAKLLYALCSLFGRGGRKAGLAVVGVLWAVLLYGSFVGPRQLEVRRVEVTFSDLPPAFDGYRIVHFSDLHLGSSSHDFIGRLVDSINAQQPDLVAFTGDIQNKKPAEIEPYVEQLSAIEAPDGVFSVQGNHDYALYVDEPYYVKAENEEHTVGLQQDMGWRVLANTRCYVHRGADSVVVAGMENDGEGRFPEKGQLNSALWSVSRSQFIVMLEHDPSAWRRKILTHCHAQLTLSGHTHGMQFELLGWSPLSVVSTEVDGLYRLHDRCLYVSKGVGGVVPFRFGATPEIVVLTLRRAAAAP